MKMPRRKAEVFAPTDGVLYVVSDTDALRRGADFSDASLYPATFSLAYRRVRISARDVELAEATGSEITAKVETRNVAALTPDTSVTMDGGVYELTRIEDRGRTCWLWLSEVAMDGTCELLGESYETDAVGIPRRTGSSTTHVYVRRAARSAVRTSGAGVDALSLTLALRLRANDYGGEARLKRGGRTYAVVGTEPHGRWIDLTCRERGADRG